jgi:hypothetical protein
MVCSNGKLVPLDISDNCFGTEGAKHVEEALKSNVTIVFSVIFGSLSHSCCLFPLPTQRERWNHSIFQAIT